MTTCELDETGEPVGVAGAGVEVEVCVPGLASSTSTMPKTPVTMPPKTIADCHNKTAASLSQSVVSVAPAGPGLQAATSKFDRCRGTTG